MSCKQSFCNKYKVDFNDLKIRDRRMKISDRAYYWLIRRCHRKS